MRSILSHLYLANAIGMLALSDDMKNQVEIAERRKAMEREMPEPVVFTVGVEDRRVKAARQLGYTKEDLERGDRADARAEAKRQRKRERNLRIAANGGAKS